MNASDQSVPARPDVKELLAEVEAAVAAKKSRGLYNPLEVRRVEEAAVTLQADPDVDSMERLAAYLRDNWDAKACGISTHRPGLSGRLVVGVKRLVHWLTRPYLNIALARQTAFNNQLVTLLSLQVAQLNGLRAALRQQTEQTEYRFDDVEARLTALERQLSTGNAQSEALLARLQRIVEDQSRAGRFSPGAVQEVAEVRAAGRGASYLAFEDLHRGTREEIKRRQAVYLPYFQLAVGRETPLLDLGCGRGEFLDLCREAGLPARGVDVNPAMVVFCRELGLDVAEADGLTYLRTLPQAGLGGILLSQVIEHLSLDQLTELVALCAEKLAPGGVLIAETVNPQTLSTFAGAFYVDLTHNKPVHPEAARFLWRWAGLGEVQILYLSPTAPEHQLEPLPGGPGAPDIAGAFNRNVARLNQLIYGPLDYAVVGRR
ncbi:MAG: class I SAM-dependent methyltransferase [Candidatus Methylomirabilia bacterium]